MDLRAAFYTLGCKVNQYETSVLEQQFSREGFQIVPWDQPAQVYVVNSCTVTSSGDRKSLQMLRRVRRSHPEAVVALCGCFPQAFPQAAEGVLEADIVVGSKNRSALLPAVTRLLRDRSGERLVDIAPHTRGEPFEPMAVEGYASRTRAFVKIQDGCQRFCTYCIIPKARGPVRSKPLGDLEEELNRLAQAGYREVVLVGINLPSYGVDLDLRLLDAVRLACAVPGICRVRLGSLEPELLTPGDIRALAGLDKLCPQFHLSLQSGCDATLRRMGRHYDTSEYRRIVADLRDAFPGCAITTDIMVGFPGETEEEFAQSLGFAREIGFARAHVFVYSPREGTPAATMGDQVPQEEKLRRSKELMAATNQSRRDFWLSQTDTQGEVLFETLLPDGWWEGYSKNYTPVKVQSRQALEGQIRRVTITGAEEDHCTAVLLEEPID